MFADRLKTLAPSPTLAIQTAAKAMRARGIEVISFSVGEPDFDTPERIKKAAIRALEQGQTKYTDVSGIPELRAAVCQKFRRDNGLDYEPGEILISCGAKHTLYNIFTALLNSGDEVLVPSPYWVSYPEQVRLVGAVPVPVPTDEERGFQIDPSQVMAAVSPHTKAIVLNSPNNPTGAVFAPETLQTVAQLAVDRGLWVISDECYEALTYDGRHPSIASLGAEVKARTIVVNTCSKAYAMTGWRIGYAAGPRALIAAMGDIQSQVTSNPSSIAQWAAVEALAGPQDDVAKMVGEFDRRRRVMVEGLNRISGIRCPRPAGAFYVFPNVSELFGKIWQGRALKGSSDITAFLLEAAQVAVVPGLDFGSDCHIRLSYATDLETITHGLARMNVAVRSLGG